MREALIAAMGSGAAAGLPGARWQDDDQLHLTLRFIGEVDRHAAEDVAAALGSVAHPSFTLKLAGIGCFDRRGRIDNIWAGVAPHDPVRSLHVAVTRALGRVGIAAEARAFIPHITLARLSHGPDNKAALPIDHIWPAPVEAQFDHFILYESELGATGASYSAIERYPLG